MSPRAKALLLGIAIAAVPSPAAADVEKAMVAPRDAVRFAKLERSLVLPARSARTWTTRRLHARAAVAPRAWLNGRRMRLDYAAADGLEGIWRRATATVTVRGRPGRTPLTVRIANYGPRPVRVRVVLRVMVGPRASPPVEAPDEPDCEDELVCGELEPPVEQQPEPAPAPPPAAEPAPAPVAPRCEVACVDD